MDSGSSRPQHGWASRSGHGAGRGRPDHGGGTSGGYTTTYPVIGGLDVFPRFLLSLCCKQSSIFSI